MASSPERRKIVMYDGSVGYYDRKHLYSSLSELENANKSGSGVRQDNNNTSQEPILPKRMMEASGEKADNFGYTTKEEGTKEFFDTMPFGEAFKWARQNGLKTFQRTRKDGKVETYTTKYAEESSAKPKAKKEIAASEPYTQEDFSSELRELNPGLRQSAKKADIALKTISRGEYTTIPEEMKPGIDKMKRTTPAPIPAPEWNPIIPQNKTKKPPFDPAASKDRAKAAWKRDHS